MKKFTSTFFLTIILSISVFANDGTTHSGGKTCPNNQTTCFAGQIEQTENDSTYKKIITFLKTLFG